MELLAILIKIHMLFTLLTRSTDNEGLTHLHYYTLNYLTCFLVTH